jgi:hypothetical protein
MIAFLAALRANLPEPPGGTPKVEIRDIAPPIDFFTWPSWKVLVAVGLGLVLLAYLAWKVIYSLTHRPAPPPPTPRQLALAELARLREQVHSLDAYAFSIAVSGVLREFIERQYFLRALEQTSPEFLASIAQAKEFTSGDRQLLAEFLDRSDMIKFARVEAGVEASESLLQSALAFVQGGCG